MIDQESNDDITDVNEYLNEYIKGIHLSFVNFDGIKELLEEIEKLIAEKPGL